MFNLMENSKSNANMGFVDVIMSFLIVIITIVQPIKSFFSITNSMVIGLCLLPYLILKLVFARYIAIKGMLPVIIYFLWIMYVRNWSVEFIITSIILILLVLCVYNELLDINRIYRYAVIVCGLNLVALLIQYFGKYILGVHIQFLHAEWLRTADMISGYFVQLSTGMTLGLFRPSGFFLEPSGYAQFALPVLFISLFYKNKIKNYKIPIIITIGIILSTSGIGIASALGFWGIYLFINTFYGKRFNQKYFLIFCGILITAIIAIIFIPFLQNSILRIFIGIEDNQYSAIQGRLGSGITQISFMSKQEMLYGIGNGVESVSRYLSGMYYKIVESGIIGFVLYCIMYIYFSIKMKNRFSILAIFNIILAIFANTVTVHSMILTIAMLAAGFATVKEDK